MVLEITSRAAKVRVAKKSDVQHGANLYSAFPRSWPRTQIQTSLSESRLRAADVTVSNIS